MMQLRINRISLKILHLNNQGKIVTFSIYNYYRGEGIRKRAFLVLYTDSLGNLFKNKTLTVPTGVL